MGRLARVVAAGILHHVTQRGNRRQQTFFCEDDYREYIPLMPDLRIFRLDLVTSHDPWVVTKNTVEKEETK